MSITLTPLKGKRRRDCTRCFGEARQAVLVDGKKTGLHVCVWCARSLEHGHLIVSRGRLIPPPKFRAKRGDES